MEVRNDACAPFVLAGFMGSNSRVEARMSLHKASSTELEMGVVTTFDEISKLAAVLRAAT